MRGARLSFDQLNDYLDLLLTRGLISHEAHTRAYVITDKGSRLLAVSEEMNQIDSM
jgi:predicted transcriptional regulator